MKTTSKNILNLWRKKSDWRATLTEIQVALGAKKTQTAEIKELLEKMTHTGVLVRAGHRYQRSVKTKPASAKPSAAKGAAKAHPIKSPAKAHPLSKPAKTPPSNRPTHSRLPNRDSLPSEAHLALVGIFSAHPNGFAFVEIPGRNESLFIPPKEVGGALDGDWVRLEEVPPKAGKRGYARVLEVVRRRRERIRGRFHRAEGHDWVAPLNEKVPMIYLPPAPELAELSEDTLVEVVLTHFPRYADEAPEGRLVAQLESESEPDQVVRHILVDTGLSGDFSPATLAEMDKLPASLPADILKDRVDLQNKTFVTIDGKDARDFDDAICLESLDNGNWRLSVAIADVAHYVVPGTAVDEDAFKKGTSVYFPGQVFPMLPHALSSDLCSLKPRVPRLALTCEIEMTAKGARVDYRVFESVIRSKERLTYGQVQQYFETGSKGSLTGPVAAMLADMRRLAKALREKRHARGAVDFLFPEYRFELDAKGYPKRINTVYPMESTRLIEQLMLEANEAVAQFASENRLPVLYRVHDAPPKDALVNLVQILWNHGIKAKEKELSTPEGIQAVLQTSREHPRREVIDLAVLRSMSQAQYRASNDGHFALAAEYYSHFTSPIRRYPDLLLHRAIKSKLRGRKAAILPDMAGLHLSTCERVAAEAEQRVGRLYKVLYMEPRVGEVFTGLVTGVSDRGVFLSLREHPVEGLLPINRLPGPEWRFNRERNELVSRGKPPVRVGRLLSVRLERADRLTQTLDFSLERWEIEAEAPRSRPGFDEKG